MGLHALCCGLPALAMLVAAASGTATSFSLVSDTFKEFHTFMHVHEMWILAVSAALVAIGGGLELLARRTRAQTGFPWLFAFSAACFAVNLAIILAHRG